MTGMVELYGGPLDGQLIELDISIDNPNLDAVRLVCVPSDDYDAIFREVVIYRVKEWNSKPRALVFEGYEDE